MILDNQKLIAPFVKEIEVLKKLPIYNKLEEKSNEIRRIKLKLQNEYDINDPKKYKKMEVTKNYHPLALHYYEVQEQLRPYCEKRFCQLTTGIISLSEKCKVISTLLNAGVHGLEKKLDKLVSDNITDYEKSMYGMTVASQYVLAGHSVLFVDTSSHKSADLLIDNIVEIECKKKDLIHPYYQSYENLWEVITKNALEWMDRSRLNYMIYVKVHRDIENDSVTPVKAKIHEIVLGGMEGSFKLENDKVTIEAKKLLPYDFESDDPMTEDYYPKIMKAIPNVGEIDFMQPSMRVYRTKDKVIQKNFRFLSMKIPQLPVRTIISNTKKAIRQFTNLFPSIIYIDISALNQKMKIPDLENLGNQVSDILRNNSIINAVVITDTYTTGLEGNAVIKNGIWIIHNPISKCKLPQSFIIPNQTNSSKESLIADYYWA